MAWSSLAVVAASSVGMAYVYFGVMKLLPKGMWRLLALLPLLAFYVYMPLKLGTVFERGLLSFFFTWLTSFKLVLLCWDAGPASDPWAIATFPRFLAVMNLSLHLKTQSSRASRIAPESGGALVAKKLQDPASASETHGKHNGINTSSIQRKRMKSDAGKDLQQNNNSTRLKNHGTGSMGGRNFFQILDESKLWYIVLLRLFFKFIFLAMIIASYSFRAQLPWWVIYILYSAQIYITPSLIFDGVSLLASAALGIEIEPAFNKPFLSDSLTDFWGRRWNLLVSNLMRVAVYEPVLCFCGLWGRETSSGKFPVHKAEAEELNGAYKPIEASRESMKSSAHLNSPGFDSQKLSRLPLWPRSLALFLCLVVSGLMHELIFFYMTLSPPTWDATAFFTLQGIMSVFEIFIRRKFRIKVIKLVSVPITLCVMFFSALWLFYPSVCRGGTDFKAISEFQGFFRNFLPQYYPS